MKIIYCLNICFIFVLLGVLYFFNYSGNSFTNNVLNNKDSFEEKNDDRFYVLEDNKKTYFHSNNMKEFDSFVTVKKYVKEPLGIYVDFIYNPNFNTELKIVQYILLEILNKTKINFFYDFENLSNSTVITTGYEEGYIIGKKDLITIKPKLLKDVLYNENIFSRIYFLISNYFRIGQNFDIIPEYDRTINYKKYKIVFEEYLKKLDHVNFNNLICRNELKYKFKNRFCIKVNYDYINKIFTNDNTKSFYKTFLYRISWFVSKIIAETTNLVEVENDDDCYEIFLTPETDITKVLLLPHSSVITALTNEVIPNDQEFFNKVFRLIITIKHRILHSLGLIHKYTLPSVMANYENVFQKNNLFFIMLEDYEALNQCYGNYENYPYFVKNKKEFNQTLFNFFIRDFATFKNEYLKYHY